MALISGCVCGDCPNGQCVGCARGGELCLPNDPDMITPRMLSEIGGGISKTRGVPSMGSTNYGPRGHSMAQFQNASGAPLWFNQTATTTTTTEPALDKYTNIFKEKNYWIGVVVGIAGLMAYQKYVKK
jgi:hypothetical protein|tara:strand:- start:498 stop:881 length:384 start_codon:yes stop_codon:yes gene_type:complete